MKINKKRILIGSSVLSTVMVAGFAAVFVNPQHIKTNTNSLNKPNSGTTIKWVNRVDERINDLSLPNKIENINDLKQWFSQGEYKKSSENFAITSPKNSKVISGYIASLTYSIIDNKKNLAFIYSNPTHNLSFSEYNSNKNFSRDKYLDKNDKQYFIRYEMDDTNQYKLKQSIELPDSRQDLIHKYDEENKNDLKIKTFNNRKSKGSLFHRKTRLVNVITDVKYSVNDEAFYIYGINGYLKKISLDCNIEDVSNYVNFQIGRNGKINTGFNGLKDYPNIRKFETKGFTEINGAKYFFGEGQFLSKVVGNDVSWQSHSLFDFNDFDNQFDSKSTREWSNYYTSNYEKKWRKSISVVLEGKNSSEIIAFGEDGKYLVIDVSNGKNNKNQDDIKANDNSRGIGIKDSISKNPVGKIISGFKNGKKGYVLATEDDKIVILDKNYNVDKVFDAFADTAPNQAGSQIEKTIIKKIVPDGLGGYIVHAASTRLDKKDIYNFRYSPVSRNNESFADKPSNDQYSYPENQSQTSVFLSKVGNWSDFYQKTRSWILKPYFTNYESYIYHFDDKNNLKTFNNTWGKQTLHSPTYTKNYEKSRHPYDSREDYKYNGIKISNFTAIRDIAYDGHGGIYAIHVDNTLRHLNADGFDQTWDSSADFKEKGLAKLKSAEERQEFIDNHKGINASVMTDDANFIISGSNGRVTILNLSSNNEEAIVKKVNGILNTNSEFNNAEKLGNGNYLLSGYNKTNRKSFGVLVIKKNDIYLTYEFESKIPNTQVSDHTNERHVISLGESSSDMRTFAINSGNQLNIAIINTKKDFVKVFSNQSNDLIIGARTKTIDWNIEKSIVKEYTGVNKKDKTIKTMSLAPDNGNLLVFFTSNKKLFVSEFSFNLMSLDSSKEENAIERKDIFAKRFCNNNGINIVPIAQTQTSKLNNIDVGNDPVIRIITTSRNEFFHAEKDFNSKQLFYTVNDKIYKLHWENNGRSGFRTVEPLLAGGGVPEFSESAISDKSNLVETINNHIRVVNKDDLKITAISHDGVGGYIVGTNSQVIFRFNKDWELLNYEDISKYMGENDKVNSINLSKLGTFVISTSSIDKSTVILNRVLKKGFIDFSTTENAFWEPIFENKITSEQFKQYFEAWYEKEDFELDKKTIKIPEAKNNSLKKIKISGSPSNLKIQDEALFTTIKDRSIYFKDIEIQYSISNTNNKKSSLLNSKGELQWITGKDNFIKLLKLSEDKKPITVEGVALNAYQFETLNLNNVVVRFNLKDSKKFNKNKEVQPIDFGKEVKPTFEKIINKINLYQDAFNGGDTPFMDDGKSTFWHTVNTTDNGFSIHRGQNKKLPISSNNFSIEPPVNLSNIKFFQDGIFEIKYSLSNESNDILYSPDQVKSGQMQVKADSKVYFTLVVADGHRNGNKIDSVSGPGGFVFRRELKNQNLNFGFYKTIPQEIQNFIIPIVLNGAKIQNVKFDLNGNSKDLEIKEEFIDDFDIASREKFNVEYAFGETSSDVKGVHLDGDAKWFTCEEFQATLKKYYKKRDIPKIHKTIWARLRMRSDVHDSGKKNNAGIYDTSNGIKYSWNTEAVKIYNGVEDKSVAGISTGDFKLFYRTEEAFRDVINQNVKAVGTTDASLTLSNTANFNVEKLIANGINILYSVEIDKSKSEIYNPNQPIDASKHGGILSIKLEARSGFVTETSSNEWQKIEINSAKLIEGISKNDLSDPVKLIFKGNTKNLEIEETDALFVTKTEFFNKASEINLKDYIGIHYRETNAANWKEKDDFIKHLKNLSVKDSNNMNKDLFEAKYFLKTRSRSNNFTITDVSSFVNPNTVKVKKLIDIKDIVNEIKSKHVNAFKTFAGSTNSLSIVPGESINFDALNKIGLRAQYIFFKNPDSSTRKSEIQIVDIENSSDITNKVKNIGSYIPEFSDLDSNEIFTSEKNYKPSLFSIRFVRLDDKTSEISEVTYDSKTLDNEDLTAKTFVGFKIDTSNIIKTIPLKAESLTKLELDGETGELKILRTTIPFNHISKGIEGTDLRDKFEIQYSIGSKDGENKIRLLDNNLEWFSEIAFIANLKTYQLKYGPLLLDRIYLKNNNIAGKLSISTRYVLKAGVDKNKYEIEQTAERPLNVEKVKTTIDLKILIEFLKDTFITTSAITSEDIRNFIFKISPEWKRAIRHDRTNNSDDVKIMNFLSVVGVKTQFLASKLPGAKWVSNKNEITSLGSSSELKIRFVLDEENTDASNLINFVFPIGYIENDGAFLRIKLPETIKIDDAEEKLEKIASVSGNTKDIVIDIKQDILNAAPDDNPEKVEVQFAIGKDLDDLVFLNPEEEISRNWFNKEEFTKYLKEYSKTQNKDFTFPYSTILMRFGIVGSKGNQSNEDFSISSLSNIVVKMKIERVKTFVNIANFIEKIKNETTDFTDVNGLSGNLVDTAHIETIELPFEAVDFIAMTQDYKTAFDGKYSEVAPIKIQFAVNSRNIAIFNKNDIKEEDWIYSVGSGNYPADLGSPAKLFVRFFSPSNGYVFDTQDNTKTQNTVSEVIEINIKKSGIKTHIKATKQHLKSIKFSGSTKNIIIDTSKFDLENVEASENTTILYSLSIGNQGKVSLDEKNKIKKEFEKNEFIKLLNEYGTDIFLRRLNPETGEKEGNYFITTKFAMKKNAVETSKLAFDGSFEYEDENLKELKSFIHVEKLFNNISSSDDAKQIIFTNGTTSTKQIKGIDLPTIVITATELAHLIQRGFEIQFSDTKEFTSVVKLKTGNFKIDPPLELKDFLFIKFKINDKFKNFSEFETKYETMIIKKPINELSIPESISVDTKELDKIVVLGDTKTLEIDESNAVIPGNSIIKYSFGIKLDKLKEFSDGNATFFSKNDMIKLMSQYTNDFTIEEKNKLVAKYDLASDVIKSKYIISDESTKDLKANDLKVFIDLEKDAQSFSRGGIILGPGSNTDLLINPKLPKEFTQNDDEKIKYMKDLGIELQFTISKAGVNDHVADDSKWKTIVAGKDFPFIKVESDSRLWYRFESTNDEIIISENLKETTPIVLEITHLFKLSTEKMIKNVKLSGTTRFLDINDDNLFKNTDNKIGDNAQVDILNMKLDIDVEYSVGKIGFDDGDVWMPLTELKIKLRTFHKNIVEDLKNFRIRFIAKSKDFILKCDNDEKCLEQGYELDSKDVKAFIHADEVISELKKSTTIFNNQDTTSNITGINLGGEDLPLKFREELLKYENYFDFKYSNEKVNAGTEPSSFGKLPDFLNVYQNGDNRGDPFLWIKLIPKQLFTMSSENQKPFLLKIQVNKQINTKTNDLTKLKISGNTKNLKINDDEVFKNFVGQLTDGDGNNLIQILYSISGNPTIEKSPSIEFEKNKTWYTKDELMADLLKYKSDLKSKQIWAKFVINSKYQTKDGDRWSVSDPDPVIVEDDKIQENSKVKIFVHNLDFIDLNEEKIQVSGFVDTPTINIPKHLFNNTELSIGLELQYSIKETPVYSNSSQWTKAQPLELEKPLALNVKIVAKPGYYFDDNGKIYKISTATVRERINLVDARNKIKFSGNTKDIVIEDEEALENTNFTNPALKNKVIINYSLGLEIDGKMWFNKEDFKKLLKDLDGTIKDKKLIINRDYIYARYELKDTEIAKEYRISLTDDKTKNGIPLKAFNNVIESNDVKAVQSNLELKTYINLKLFEDYSPEKIVSGGNDKEPEIIITDKLLDKIKQLKESNPGGIPFDIRWTTEKKTSNVPDFDDKAKVLDLNNDEILNNFKISEKINSKKPFIALQIVSKDDYVLSSHDAVVVISDYSKTKQVVESKVKTDAVTVSFRPDEDKYYKQGEGIANIIVGGKKITKENMTEIFGENLKFVYLASTSDYSDVASIDNSLFKDFFGEEPRKGLFVHDNVYIKLVVTDEKVFSLSSQNQLIKKEVVKGLKLDTEQLKKMVDTVTITFANSSTLQAFPKPLDGLSKIGNYKISTLDVNKNFEGIDIKYVTKLFYYKDAKGSVIADRNNAKMIQRENGIDFNPLLKKDGQTEIFDLNGNAVGYQIDSTGGYTSPLGENGNEHADAATMISQTLTDKGNGNFEQLDSIHQLYEGQKLKFSFNAKSDYILNETIEYDYIVKGLKFKSNVDLILDPPFAKAKEKDPSSYIDSGGYRTPRDGFSQVKNALSFRGKDSENRTFQETLDHNDLKIKIVSKRKVNNESAIIVHNNLEAFKNLKNGDELEIFVESKNERFNPGIESIRITVYGLSLVPTISDFEFLRIETKESGSNSEGAFEILTNNIITPEKDKPKAQGYKWEYGIIKKDLNYDEALKTLEFSDKNKPTGLSNGDIVLWRLINIDENGERKNVVDYFNNKVRNSNEFTITVDNEEKTLKDNFKFVKTTIDGKTYHGYLVNGLQEIFRSKISVVEFQKLIKKNFTVVGEDKTGQIKQTPEQLDAIVTKLDKDTTYEFVKDGNVITNLAKNLKNGDVITVRLVLNQAKINKNFIIASDAPQFTFTIKDLEDPSNPLNAAAIITLYIFGTVVSGGIIWLIYILLKRKRFK